MQEPTNKTPEPKTLGLLAEFPGPDELVAAAAKTTDSGYRRVEAFSPFPIHGIDEALKAKKTILPWLVFLCGLTGCVAAQAMQHYMNGVESWWMFSGYEYRISGKPYFSVPSTIPVTFEVIVLLSAFGAFFGMLALNGLPRLSNPLFRSERFSTATSHGFFLWIDAKDKKFDPGGARAHLESIGATATEPVEEEVDGHDVPGLIYLIGVVTAAAALVPPLWVAAAKGESSVPRLAMIIWRDMDYQPKYKAQTQTSRLLFADGRAMRGAVPGTVARGDLRPDLDYYRGYTSEPTETASAGPRARFVNFLQEAGADGDAPPAEAPPEPDWATEFPARFEVSEATMDRGEQRFNIYCAACHGLDGQGLGLVTKRARDLEQGTWVTPTNINSEDVRKQPVGKLFHSISNGVRRMPGYAQQIAVEDRWAIVLYVRALQRQQNATLDDIPAGERDKLQ